VLTTSVFAGILQSPETSSKVSCSLHTAKVAGSNPASPTHKKAKRMHHETFARLGIKYLKAVKEYQEAQREQTAHLIAQLAQEGIKFDL
jgi:hypothetical protein